MKTKKKTAPRRAGTRSIRELRVAHALVRMQKKDPPGFAQILAQFPELSDYFQKK